MSSSITRQLPITFGEKLQISQLSEALSEVVAETPMVHTGKSILGSIISDGSDDVAACSDERLMSRVCHGDTDGLGLLFRRYARVVRSVAFRVLRDSFEADDLLQEIFLLVHSKCRGFDASKGSARSWILQMTYRRAINRRQYLGCRHFYTHVGLEDAEAQLCGARGDERRLEEAIDVALGKSDLQRLMAGLSDNQQKTLRLHFFEGYTLDEIAAQLGQTKGNVKHHYFRGLERLRKQIFPKGRKQRLQKQIFDAGSVVTSTMTRLLRGGS